MFLFQYSPIALVTIKCYNDMRERGRYHKAYLCLILHDISVWEDFEFNPVDTLSAVDDEATTILAR